MSDAPAREVLTAEQAAQLLQVSVRTVLEFTRDGAPRGDRVRRAWRFRRADVLASVGGGRLVRNS